MLTPNLDRFLKEGLVFRNSYVQVAVCGPSRSSVLTGRRPDSTHINAAPPNSWCWAQRGYFMTIPHYFKESGYITAGAGKLFHPDGCNMSPSTNNGNWVMHPPELYYGQMSNFSHTQGDDPAAWSLPYFPQSDTTTGDEADCVQFGVVPCPCIDFPHQCKDPHGTMGLSSDPQQDKTDLEHPDGRIATWGVVTLTNFSRHGIGVKGSGKAPFFLSVGLHKPQCAPVSVLQLGV